MLCWNATVFYRNATLFYRKATLFSKKILYLHHGKYDRDFHERGTGYFYSGIVPSAVRHSHELCHGSRLQDIINSKTNNIPQFGITSSI